MQDGVPVLCKDVLEWGRWLEKAHETMETRVAHDRVGGGDLYTSFLAIDHNWGSGPPLLYETMFHHGSSEWADFQWHYSTRTEAEAGHAKAKAMIEQGEMPE